MHAHQRGLAGPTLAGVPIRILIVDALEAWHSIYTEVLRPRPQLQIVGTARSGAEALQLTRELNPDVVLLDVGLSRTDCLNAARQISLASPASRLLILGTTAPPQLAEIALKLGAYGYLAKRDVVLDLVAALEAIAEGGQFPGRAES